MSLMSALSVSLTGLQVATSQMSLVANNISNAGKEGYSSKGVTLESVVLGKDAGGSRISGYTRVTDDATLNTLRTITSEDGLRSKQDYFMSRVSEILGTNTSAPALSDAMNEFAAAWRQLEAAPESSVQQKQVIRAGTNLTMEIQSLARSIEDLDRSVHSDIDNTVNQLNNDLELVADYNQRIAAAISSNQPPGDLEDDRDKVILRIASVTKITILPREQGQVALYTPQGYLLLDGRPQTFSYDGTDVTAASNPSASLNDILSGGSLEAGVKFRSDASPATASTDPATEVIRKLRSQMDAIVDAFTTSTAGPPESFAHAYNPAGTVGMDFFSGTDRTTFAVTAGLVAGTTALTSTNASDVVDAFNDSSKTFTADGISLSGSSYEKLGADIIAGFQQAANNIADLSSPAASQKAFLEKKYYNNIGVNVDTELVALTTLQNAYNASARVISIINQMFDTLEEIMR